MKTNLNIGAAVRGRRKSLEMTLKDVADRTGLSVGFLSQVERNITSPSLSSLVAIADVIDVSVDFFLSAPKPEDMVSRREQREFFELDGLPVKYARVSNELPEGKLHAVMDLIPPGFVSEVTTHVGEDFLYVVSGRIWMNLGDERYELEEGDTIHFQASIPHQWGNDSEQDSLCLSVGTQPLFALRKR